MATATDNIVTTWKLDAKDLKKTIDGQLSNIKSGLDMIRQYGGGLASALGKAIESAGKLIDLQDQNTLSINEAAAATKNYISRMDLLAAANKVQTSGLNLTSTEFAKLAEGATVLSKRLGVDAKSATDQLTQALATNQTRGLKSLGIMVDMTKAEEQLAQSLGVTTSQLSEQQKRALTTAEVMQQLETVVKQQGVSVDNVSDNWETLRNATLDATTAFTAFILRGVGSAAGMAGMTRDLNDIADAMGRITPHRERQMGITSRLAEISREIQVREGTAEREQIWVPGVGGIPANIKDMKSDLKALYAEQAVLNKQLSANRVANELDANMRIASDAERKLTSMAEALSAMGSKKGGGRKRKRKQLGVTEAPVGLADVWGEEAEGARVQTFERDTETLGIMDEVIKDTQKLDRVQHSWSMVREAAVGAGDGIAYAGEQMREAAEGGVQTLAMGLWSAADAAIQGSESFGMAMAKMLKATLLSIAGEATVQALMETAKGVAALAVMNYPGAAQHFSSAGIFAAAAVATGTAGLALSAATAGGSSSSASSGGGASRDYSSKFSGTKTTKAQPINISVYLGDPGDPSAALMMQKQLTAQLKKAA